MRQRALQLQQNYGVTFSVSYRYFTKSRRETSIKLATPVAELYRVGPNPWGNASLRLLVIQANERLSSTLFLGTQA